MVGTGVSVPRNDGRCRDVLQKESPSGIPAGQLEREALESVEASPSCTGSVHGKHAVIVIMKCDASQTLSILITQPFRAALCGVPPLLCCLLLCSLVNGTLCSREM